MLKKALKLTLFLLGMICLVSPMIVWAYGDDIGNVPNDININCYNNPNVPSRILDLKGNDKTTSTSNYLSSWLKEGIELFHDAGYHGSAVDYKNAINMLLVGALAASNAETTNEDIMYFDLLMSLSFARQAKGEIDPVDREADQEAALGWFEMAIEKGVEAGIINLNEKGWDEDFFRVVSKKKITFDENDGHFYLLSWNNVKESFTELLDTYKNNLGTRIK